MIGNQNLIILASSNSLLIAWLSLADFVDCVNHKNFHINRLLAFLLSQRMNFSLILRCSYFLREYIFFNLENTVAKNRDVICAKDRNLEN